MKSRTSHPNPIHAADIKAKLLLLENSFKALLYEKDEVFLKNLQATYGGAKNLAQYQFWEWTQGVGLYGFWQLFQKTRQPKYLLVLQEYYDKQIAIGLPEPNVNTIAPLLALSYLAEETGNTQYLEICQTWAKWIMQKMPRTLEGGFQHQTSDSINHEELWDDTLFMTVLFLAKMGQMLDETSYKEEAIYQFLLHGKYLWDKETDLWYHGWCFEGKTNFAQGLWGRGNCWITISIPLLLDMIEVNESSKRMLMGYYQAQIEALKKYQSPEGMWHTLLDDPSSYLEASATCGFGYGILLGIKNNLLPRDEVAVAMKALQPVVDKINPQGVLTQVSYGTPMGRESKDFYKNIPLKPMPYGQALGILFLTEALEFL